MAQQKKGLVLEGGAMRGMFTAGVLDVFMEKGITFDGAIGVSAGATFGCNFKSNQIGRAIRYNCTYMRDKRYCSYSSLLTTGNMFNTDFCYDKMPNVLDPFDYEAYQSNPMEFYMVTTDIISGKPVYYKMEKGDAHDLVWMRASASMPLVSKPVKVDGYTMLDGGITDSIPLQHFEGLGYNKNVVVLTQPKKFVKQKTGAIRILKLFLHKYPALIKAMEDRHNMYNRQTAHVFEQEKSGSVFVIAPDESLNLSRTEKRPEELVRVYNIGRRTALAKINELKDFFKD